MTDPKIPEPEPVAQVQRMGSFQGVPHYGCLLTIAAERRMKVNDPLYGSAELETYAAAREAAARMEERERLDVYPQQDPKTFSDWLGACKGRADSHGDINYHWAADIKMGEHDAALMAWRFQQREIDRLRAALLSCARQAEALKQECGMDPESAQAARNGRYQAISTTAHIALGTIKGAA